jgi:hypothetical protein
MGGGAAFTGLGGALGDHPGGINPTPGNISGIELVCGAEFGNVEMPAEEVAGDKFPNERVPGEKLLRAELPGDGLVAEGLAAKSVPVSVSFCSSAGAELHPKTVQPPFSA